MTGAWTPFPPVRGGTTRHSDVVCDVGTRTLRVDWPNGFVEISDESLVRWATGVVIWCQPATRRIVVCGEESASVYLINLTDSTSSVAVVLERSNDETQRFVRCEELGDSLLIMYEGGIAALNADGSLRWHSQGKWRDVRVRSFQHDVVRLEVIHEHDDHEELIGFRLSDGRASA